MPHKGCQQTEEAKRKISEARKGKYQGKDNSFYGKYHTEETKRKQSEAQKGMKKIEDDLED